VYVEGKETWLDNRNKTRQESNMELTKEREHAG
jgi:hypothetical protein